jgi:hypothetical protein
VKVIYYLFRTNIRPKYRLILVLLITYFSMYYLIYERKSDSQFIIINVNELNSITYDLNLVEKII